jgi:uncharacterized protein
MTEKEWELVHRFKSLVEQKLQVHQMIVFGSRARGDAEEESDLDVLVIVNEPETRRISELISECAWETCFGSGIILSPLMMSRDRWENGPERSSLLASAVREEGIPV